MKNIISVFILTFLSLSISSQESDKDSVNDVLAKIVTQKQGDYFKIDSIIGNKYNLRTIPEESFYKLYENSLKNKYLIGQIYAYNNIGRLLRRKSQYRQSIKYHKKALDLAESLDNINIRVHTLNLLGTCYRRQDDVKNALNLHQSALSLSKRVKSESIVSKRNTSVSINSIGNIYLTLQQYDLALDQFEKSLLIAKELQNKLGLAINYQNIGFSQENLGYYDKAIQNYNKSLEINKEINSDKGKIICYNSLSSIYIKKREYDMALQLMEEIYPLAISHENNFYTARTLTNLGTAYLKNENFDKAEKYLKEASDLSQKHGFKKTLIQSNYTLAELYEVKEKPKLAFDYYKKAVDIERNTIGEKNISYVNNLISKYNLDNKNKEISYLESKTKIESLLYSRNRNILIITLVTIALSSIALYSVYRQRLINNDRKILLLEQQALQTQMNPHFIFNALNSIKLYVINNDQKQAVYYLNKFSKLIRNILEVSKVKEVSLKEELSTMELYMTIENIRFSNEINYSVDINTDLNTDTIKVPPLVLQPFLENAIWHGLSSKEGEKKITLTADRLSNDLVAVNITDNGIGREAANKIKKSKSLKRKSVGIDLTIERLKTFAEDYDEEFKLTYHDLKNDDGSPAGTKVSIEFPAV
ncbi:tetratricopeptide repeat-containing sensor histidine kinase [Tenacibaculum agarivorans]|uniref:tetratricopeptide repeat-containing sensor histidine kinase n=1 Tax=Tenacibaculum agarivorans TaxID=1908389 RepID=UPI00094BBF64|nr:tetratricopeptide repeat protein [Tenacibaculum agarivorans]